MNIILFFSRSTRYYFIFLIYSWTKNVTFLFFKNKKLCVLLQIHNKLITNVQQVYLKIVARFLKSSANIVMLT
jgi:hypothetical protein